MVDIEILKKLRLGTSVAEEERKDLASYFIRTDAWERLTRGDVDIVYGGKGAGKSALYLLLLDEREKLLHGRHIHLIAGENVSEDPVFKILDEDSNITEQEFIRIWKLYILSLLGNYAKEHFAHIESVKPLLKRLEDAGLIPAEGLSKMLKVAMRYLSKAKPSASAEIEGVKYSISLGEPTIEEEESGVISAQELLRQLNGAFASAQVTVWILFDRLDVAFTRPEVETPALRALFRVYRDMSGLENLRLKIFLRSDIWERITRQEGFREQSHIVRSLTLAWNPEALRHLVLSRFFSNPEFEALAGIDRETALSKSHLQTSVLSIIFPPQVESGTRKSETFDWILKRVEDGKSVVAPREVIHLITAAKEDQIHLDETGGTGSSSRHLISANALKNALEKVSQRKVETVYAEYPNLRPYVEAFRGMKTEHNESTIVDLFGARSLSGDPSVVIKDLLEIGFLQERRSTEGVSYWVPFIFRSYLSMSQGSAFAKERTISIDE